MCHPYIFRNEHIAAVDVAGKDTAILLLDLLSKLL